ncbi:hypothetical protein NL676_015768 [Syzygium grande]|nr:hypothetical protein NL676_015768 [Syzygium grande]
MKLLFALLLCFLLLTSIFMEPALAAPRFCESKCRARCAKAKVKARCAKYCNICCAKCKCVPSGTYGNKHQCPCYKKMKNSKGKPKCP